LKIFDAFWTIRFFIFKVRIIINHLSYPILVFFKSRVSISFLLPLRSFHHIFVFLNFLLFNKFRINFKNIFYFFVRFSIDNCEVLIIAWELNESIETSVILYDLFQRIVILKTKYSIFSKVILNINYFFRVITDFIEFDFGFFVLINMFL